MVARCIVVLDQGAQVESGTHAELMQAGHSTCSLGEGMFEHERAPESPPGKCLEDSCSRHELLPPPLRLTKSTTWDGLHSSSVKERSCAKKEKSQGRGTYRRLWNAALGEGKKSSLEQMRLDAEKMEGALQKIRDRLRCMEQTKIHLMNGSRCRKGVRALTPRN